jgi:hypothetical protein
MTAATVPADTPTTAPAARPDAAHTWAALRLGHGLGRTPGIPAAQERRGPPGAPPRAVGICGCWPAPFLVIPLACGG